MHWVGLLVIEERWTLRLVAVPLVRSVLNEAVRGGYVTDTKWDRINLSVLPAMGSLLMSTSPTPTPTLLLLMLLLLLLLPLLLLLLLLRVLLLIPHNHNNHDHNLIIIIISDEMLKEKGNLKIINYNYRCVIILLYNYKNYK